MKTKRIIALCLFLLAAFSGLCLARSDTQFYYTEEYVWWADGATIEHIDGAVYQIYTSAESPDEPAYRTVIVARVDMESYAYSRCSHGTARKESIFLWKTQGNGIPSSRTRWRRPCMIFSMNACTAKGNYKRSDLGTHPLQFGSPAHPISRPSILILEEAQKEAGND